MPVGRKAKDNALRNKRIPKSGNRFSGRMRVLTMKEISRDQTHVCQA